MRAANLLLISAALALPAAACGGSAAPASSSSSGSGGYQAQAPAQQAPAPAQQAPAPAAPAAAANDAVGISNFKFVPPTITVKAGDTVTWTNQDQVAHAISVSGLGASQPLQRGSTYSQTFASAGTFAYICSIHPFMHGTVVVT